ncbi:MAG TPA: hypothetical protein VJY35_09750 [Candidatus Eisenbacteria bacterium]|nr:hypothetical protein [Candidatus Eisenbacteria bacterium]
MIGLLVTSSAAIAQYLQPGVPRDTIRWNNPGGGSWTEASNWEPANVPDAPNEFPILRSLGTPYLVTLDQDVALGGARFDVGSQLEIQGHTFFVAGIPTNRGTIRITDGGTLRAYYGYMENRGARIVAGPGGGTVSTEVVWPGSYGTIDCTLNGPIGTPITRGSFESDGGNLTVWCGTLVNADIKRPGGSGVVTLAQSTTQDLLVHPGAECVISGFMFVTADQTSFTNHGTIRIPGRLNVGLFSNNVISVFGTGEIILEKGILDTPNGGLLIQGAGHTIRGCGTINGNIENHGTIEIECPGSDAYQSGSIDNRGAMRLLQGGCLSSGPIWNNGTMTVSGGTLWLRPGASLETAPGSQFTYAGGNIINEAAATFRDLTVPANAMLYTAAGGVTTVSGAALVNRGTVGVSTQGTLTLTAATDYLQPAGITDLSGGVLNAARGLQIQGGELRGYGTIAGSVVSSGVVKPSAAGLGPLVIQGAYQQLQGGHMNVQIAGEDRMSRLAVNGAATLGGAIEVVTGPGYQPGPGSFEVMTYGSRSGEFGDCVESMPPQYQVVPAYGPQRLDLVVSAVTGAEDPLHVPAALRLYPRSGAGAAFVLDLPRDADITVRAYDAAGREIARLAEGARAAGVHVFPLAGGRGAPPSGIYFARAWVRSGGAEETRSARIALTR